MVNASHSSEAYVQAAHILACIHGTLVLVAFIALIIRWWAWKRHRTLLQSDHLIFLVLVLLQNGLRLVDFVLSLGYSNEPKSAVPTGMTGQEIAANILDTVPTILEFSVYSLLMYHVLVVLHAIRLAQAPYVTSIQEPLEAQNADMQTRNRLNRRTLAQSMSRCGSCIFWIVFCGRPDTSFKCAATLVNVLVWICLGAAYWAEALGAPNAVFNTFFITVVSMAFALSIGFLLFGIALIRCHGELQRIRKTPSIQHASPVPSDSLLPVAVPQRGISSGSLQDAPAPIWAVPSGFSFPSFTGRGSVHSPMLSGASSPWIATVHDGTSPRPSSLMLSQAARSFAADASPRIGLSHPSVKEVPKRSSCTSQEAADVTVLSDKHEMDPGALDPLLKGLKLMLFVAMVCLFAFAFRGCAAAYLFCAHNGIWTSPELFLAYFTVSESLPSAVTLPLYLQPGLRDLCNCHRDRTTFHGWCSSTTASGAHVDPSVVEEL